MIDSIIRDATSRVVCGQASGTAWLIAKSTVITARHCIVDAIEHGAEIKLILPLTEGSKEFQAKILATNDDFDVCLMSLEEEFGGESLPVNAVAPREGSLWRSFGFPDSKNQIGHRLSGSVSHVLDTPKLRMDMDLTVESSHTLSSYHGLSGAPIVCDGKCVGLLRLKIDGTLGAVSVQAIVDFLRQNGVQISSDNASDESIDEHSGLADRSEFQTKFEETLAQSLGSYVFLEGAHGIGKTTFCNDFEPLRTDFLSLGTYSFTPSPRGSGTVVRAQPETFFEWLSTSISVLVTGKPPRKEERNYLTMVSETSQYLDKLGQYCESKTRLGILFIDGINESFLADAAATSKLIGLLPPELPRNLVVVLTAPNYSTVSTHLSQYVKTKNVIAIPRLSDEACFAFCMHELSEQKRSLILAEKICEKAKGHPLYLRYLIEFANVSDHTSLDEFPVLSGQIEEYYESLWSKLLVDADAINLLAIIARLRWGVKTSDLLGVLYPSEQSVFVATISRIRHLLHDPETPEIYHSSFADFVCTKTSGNDSIIHKRVAEFCSKTSNVEYCRLNAIYHLLRSDEEGRGNAIYQCQQQWVDDCVALGVEPDVLLEDVESVLSVAIDQGRAVECIRLLLLLQRINFRYNILFAQSAHLIAEALIALDRPREAIKHAIRFGKLIVSPDEALNIVLRLADRGYDAEALDILKPLHTQVMEWRSIDADQTINGFIALNRLHLLVNVYAQMVDGNDRAQQIASVLRHAGRVLSESLRDSDRRALLLSSARIQCVFFGVSIYFFDRYTSVAEIKDRFQIERLPESHLMTLLLALMEYCDLVTEFGKPEKFTSLAQLFADLQELLMPAEGLDEQFSGCAILDTLIELQAPVELITLTSQKFSQSSIDSIQILESNGVDVDFSAVRSGMAEWRVKSFLNLEIECPIIGDFGPTGWSQTLGQALKAISWCEGRARRERTDSSPSRNRIALNTLRSNVLPAIKFSLRKRSGWDHSYSIPEAVFPVIWERIAAIFRDCYTDELKIFLGEISQQLDSQLGLYSEGFRESLDSITRSLIGREIDPTLIVDIFPLLQKWRTHILTGVENRHELVPELLRLIPLFVKIGAHEEAHQLYKQVLGVSMGPSWYKEDQLGLMTTVLRQTPISEKLEQRLSTIAGYLERASGEMTFQRFVRYEKAALIGELSRRGLHSQAIRYFQRQSCGSLEELQQDVQHGTRDRISPTVGMRFPGGALDEQDAILRFVKNLPDTDWKLTWCLLEIFQCGDRRHIRSYAAEYARMVNRETDPPTIEKMLARLGRLVITEVSIFDRVEFLSEIRNALDSSCRPEFERLIGLLQSIDHVHESHEPNIVEEIQEAEPTRAESRAFDEEAFVMPGTFGSQSAMRSADAIFASAEQQRSLRNFEASKEEAVKGMKTLQDGGWNVWGTLSRNATRAEALFSENAADGNAVLCWYKPLIEDEQYAAKWVIAEHLIEKISDRLSTDERSSLLLVVLEHIQLMVGESKHETALFEFLGEDTGNTPQLALFKFILWLADHPHWLRRTKAADLILWLVESDDRYFDEAAHMAFSNAVGYGADVACGALDVVVRKRGVASWNRLTKTVNLQAAAADCKHVGRLAVLCRISGRAASDGDADAKAIAQTVVGGFRSGTIELDSSEDKITIPLWAHSIRHELRRIDSLGLLTREVLARLEDELAKVCAPMSIDDAWTLEKAVAASFREVTERPLSRWEAKVRFAFGGALHPYVSQRNFNDIESVLRTYNPYAPEQTLNLEFKSRGRSIIESIEKHKDYSAAIGCDDSYYLNYFECLIDQEPDKLDNTGRIVEILAVVIPSSFEAQRAVQTAKAASFGSTTYPNFSITKNTGPTCLHLAPEHAQFGTFTPAFAWPPFIELIKAEGRDFTRINWREGRSHKVQDAGRPEREGCLLAVKRSALTLPAGMKLVWIISLDNESVTVVDSTGKSLR